MRSRGSLLVAVAVVLAGASACASAGVGSGRRVGSAGVSVRLPQGWQSIALALPPGLRVDADPVARVVAASGPVSFGNGCGAFPYIFPSAAVALVVMEWLRPTPGVFPKRPS